MGNRTEDRGDKYNYTVFGSVNTEYAASQGIPVAGCWLLRSGRSGSGSSWAKRDTDVHPSMDYESRSCKLNVGYPTRYFC